jgi:hypothetical protein
VFKTTLLPAALFLLLAFPVFAEEEIASVQPDSPAVSNAPLLILEEGKDAVRCPPSRRKTARRDKKSRVFPKWTPPDAAPGSLRAELRSLVDQGRRDQAASPAFLDALQLLLDRHANDNPAFPPPSDRLPFHPAFDGPGMPPGWNAIKPEVWRFGDGFATQFRSWADTRFVLSYDPGRDWRDYSATFTVESDSWFTHPMRSSAVLYFRYHNPSDSFSLCLDSAGDITLASNEASSTRILARIPIESAVIRDGKPWTVTIRGEEIKIHHEGRCLLMATDPAHPAGTIGLESIHIPARFSSVSVTAPR